MSKDAQRQFGRQASFYSISRSHASGDSLAATVEAADARGHEIALDIATGTGFTACTLAPGVRRMIASDITPEMLAEAKKLGIKRELTNLDYMLAVAESLPFRSATFDLVTCRIAAHHFTGLEQAVQEMIRVAAPGATIVICDTVSPENEEARAWMNDVEKRRDPTHIRNLAPSEWQALLEGHGLRVAGVVMTKTRQEFYDWCRRAGVEPGGVTSLEKNFLSAPPAAAEAFEIRPSDGKIDFAWDSATLRAEKPE